MGLFDYTDMPLIHAALLVEVGADPIVTVQFNTFPRGVVQWTRSGPGDCLGTLSGAFTANKTLCFVCRADQGATFVDPTISRASINTIRLIVMNAAGVFVDGWAVQVFIAVNPGP